MTDRLTDALGDDDEDVENMQAGISGLVFGNWSDEDIAEGAREMAMEIRKKLEAGISPAPKAPE